MQRESILRVGCAAGFSGDRTDVAGPVVDALIAAGGPAVLIFETLAERTLAVYDQARYDAMAAREAIEPVEPTRRLGIGLVARRSVNWYRTERWHISSQASYAWSGRLNRLLAGSSVPTPMTKPIRCHTKPFIAACSSRPAGL